MENELIDDGSLSFLNIPRDTNSRSLQGDEVKQSRIVNTSFWVHAFLEGIETRFSKAKGTTGQTLGRTGATLPCRIKPTSRAFALGSVGRNTATQNIY